MNRFDTNIQSYGDCPDCERLERKLDKEYGRHQQELEAKDWRIKELEEALLEAKGLLKNDGHYEYHVEQYEKLLTNIK